MSSDVKPLPGFRPEFGRGLALIAAATQAIEADGHPLPIIVGGAAVEFYTLGKIASGDFDIWTAGEIAFTREITKLGFRREDRAGWFSRGFYHPDYDMGIELVSGSFFHGQADAQRILIVDVVGGHIRFPIVEDLIADRMGQFAANQAGSCDMRAQAVLLYRLASEIDRSYLDDRIKASTLGEFDVTSLESEAR